MNNSDLKPQERVILDKMVFFMKERNAEAYRRASFLFELMKATKDELRDKIEPALKMYSMEAVKDYLKIKTDSHAAVVRTKLGDYETVQEMEQENLKSLWNLYGSANWERVK
jgi:hypothetical protein